jgi:hypothetical protein
MNTAGLLRGLELLLKFTTVKADRKNIFGLGRRDRSTVGSITLDDISMPTDRKLGMETSR